MKPIAILLLLAVPAVLSSAALAADLPSKAPAYAPAPQPTWTGFYVGANAGYGRAEFSSTDFFLTGKSTAQGFVGGGQLGYNWQFPSNLVLGVEGDFQGSAQSRTDTFDLFGVAGVTVKQSMPWFATARARLGYAAGPVLLYATGGAAWVEYKIEGSALGVTLSSDDSKIAWTAGAGLEWMFLPQWSTKVEFLHIDTGETKVTLFGGNFTGRAKDNIVRAGVNYHF